MSNKGPLECKEVTIYYVKSDKLKLNKALNKWKKTSEDYKKFRNSMDEVIDELIYAKKTFNRDEYTIDLIKYLKESEIAIDEEKQSEYLHDKYVIKVRDTKEELKKKYDIFKKWQKGFEYNYSGSEDLSYNYSDVLHFIEMLINDKVYPHIKRYLMIANRVSICTIREKVKGLLNKLKEEVKKHKIKLIDFCFKSPKIASFSGGKDSAWMIIEAMNRGYDFKHIVFADTTLEFPDMYSYIDKFEKYIGQEIIRLKPKITFDDWFFKEFSRGKNTGKIHGYPFVVGLGCWIKRDLKLKQINEFKMNLKERFIDCIGIAYDEPERYQRLDFETKLAPLYEWKITEQQCRDNLEKINMLNPLYYKFKRLGCYMCPKQPMDSLLNLYLHYPELWEKMKWYEDKDWKPFKPNMTLKDLEYKFNNDKKYMINEHIINGGF